MAKRYNYVIEEPDAAPHYIGNNYFRSRYTDFCGVTNWDEFVSLEEATICSTQEEAEVPSKIDRKNILNI